MNPKPNLIAEDVALVIGFTSTLRLCGAYGGRTLYVPAEGSADHVLAALLGKDSLAKLCNAYGGTTLDVPQLEELDRWRQVRKVSELLSRGATTREISRILTMTSRYVLMLRRDAESIGLMPMVLTSGNKQAAAQQVAMFDACPADDGGVKAGTRDLPGAPGKSGITRARRLAATR